MKVIRHVDWNATTDSNDWITIESGYDVCISDIEEITISGRNGEIQFIQDESGLSSAVTIVQSGTSTFTFIYYDNENQETTYSRGADVYFYDKCNEFVFSGTTDENGICEFVTDYGLYDCLYANVVRRISNNDITIEVEDTELDQIELEHDVVSARTGNSIWTNSTNGTIRKVTFADNNKSVKIPEYGEAVVYMKVSDEQVAGNITNSQNVSVTFNGSTNEITFAKTINESQIDTSVYVPSAETVTTTFYYDDVDKGIEITFNAPNVATLKFTTDFQIFDKSQRMEYGYSGDNYTYEDPVITTYPLSDEDKDNCYAYSRAPRVRKTGTTVALYSYNGDVIVDNRVIQHNNTTSAKFSDTINVLRKRTVSDDDISGKTFAIYNVGQEDIDDFNQYKYFNYKPGGNLQIRLANEQNWQKVMTDPAFSGIGRSARNHPGLLRPKDTGNGENNLKSVRYKLQLDQSGQVCTGFTSVCGITRFDKDNYMTYFSAPEYETTFARENGLTGATCIIIPQSGVNEDLEFSREFSMNYVNLTDRRSLSTTSNTTKYRFEKTDTNNLFFAETFFYQTTYWPSLKLRFNICPDSEVIENDVYDSTNKEWVHNTSWCDVSSVFINSANTIVTTAVSAKVETDKITPYSSYQLYGENGNMRNSSSSFTPLASTNNPSSGKTDNTLYGLHISAVENNTDTFRYQRLTYHYKNKNLFFKPEDIKLYPLSEPGSIPLYLGGGDSNAMTMQYYILQPPKRINGNENYSDAELCQALGEFAKDNYGKIIYPGTTKFGAMFLTKDVAVENLTMNDIVNYTISPFDV